MTVITPEKLKEIIDAHAKWLRGEKGGARANMEGAYMAGANMARANMAGANMARAYMEGAHMEGAHMEGANMAGANMAGAYMAGAHMEGANMAGAYMAGANMAGANMARAYMEGAYMARAYMEGAYMEGGSRLVGKSPLVARVTRIISPYEFFAWRTDKGDFIQAGCRWLSVDAFRDHVAREYPGTPKADEMLRVLDFIEASFKAAT